MRTMHRAVLALAAALALAAVATSGADAYSLRISNGGSISMPAIFGTSFEAGVSVECHLTLNGTLARGPITIASFENIGSITEVHVQTETCSGGTVQALVRAISPWALRLASPPSGLPNEVSQIELRIGAFSMNASVFGGTIQCLYEGEQYLSLSLSRGMTSGVYTSDRVQTSPSFLHFVSGSLCSSTAMFEALLDLTPTQTLTVT